MRYISILILFLGSVVVSTAQLEIVPLNENTVLKKESQRFLKVKKGGGIIDTLDLPFLDDFSYAGADPYPDCDLWIDKSVYINNTVAIDPPSLGVATFDGLDRYGAPYANSGFGSADTLTVMPLDLSGRTSSSNVRLSFYYEPRGYGDKPGSSDSLSIQFKTANDQWVTVWSYADTTASVIVPSFNFVSIPIADSDYLYKGFQFRFRNMGTLTGSRDLWHIDYVRVTEGPNPTMTLNDVAFTVPPVTIFKTYSALPWKHFEGFEADELATQNQLQINNHFNTSQFVGPAKFSLFDGTGNPAFATNILNFAANPINGNMAIGLNVIDSVLATAEYTTLKNSFTPYYGSDSIVFDLEVFMSPSNQQNTVASVIRNDTASRSFIFDDYFAYDDGTAETAVAAGRIGDQFALRFHTNVDDTLKAIRLNLPRLSGTVTNQRVNLKVWVDDLDDTPDYKREFVKAVYIDSIQSWTTYSLDTNALFIPAGTTFYVGWQQATTPQSIAKSFLIGYDRNSPNGFDNLYQDVGAGWQKLDTVTVKPPVGSIMIRPIFGKGDYFSSGVKDKTTALTNIKVYPNPVRDRLNIKIDQGFYADYQYQIYNSVGMLMQSDELSEQLNLGDLTNGWYILRIINQETGQAFTQKLLVL